MPPERHRKAVGRSALPRAVCAGQVMDDLPVISKTASIALFLRLSRTRFIRVLIKLDM